jgi:CubicO group peptidase (beta-lactamase class C family)
MPSSRVSVLLAAAVLAAQPVAAQAPGSAAFDDYVTRAMQAWKVPGLAIAVVRNDSVVFTKGYGVRELGKPDRVTPNTLFAIGSASKAFTATLIAMLVDSGKVRWDDPATKYLPGFQLYDPYVTRELTVRDLLTHRSGLSRGDMLWYATTISRDSILHQIRYLKPTWSFRAHFGYQNIMLLAAGQIAAHVTGESWDDLVRQRIFTPLGMTATNTSIRALRGLSDVASPHVEIDDTVRVVPYHNIDNIGPAGSINSNVLDMARWLRFQLDGGKVGTTQLVSTAAFNETHTPQTIIPLEGAMQSLYPGAHFLTYGMGWFLSDYHGREIVEHGGNIDGMTALVAQLPEEKTGVVILTNMNGTQLPSVLMHRVFDVYLKQPPTDWSTKFLAVISKRREQAEAAERKRESERATGTSPSLALGAYAGTYVDSMYGNATVKLDNGKLVLTYGTMTGDLEHWQYDTFRDVWHTAMGGKAFVTFDLDPTGKVSDMKVEGLADFQRQPAPADTVPKVKIAASDLARYAGAFASKAPPLDVDVQVVDGTLKLNVPGQPPYTLVPVTSTRFQLTGPPGMPGGFFLNYSMNGGKVTQVVLEQPSPQPTLTLLPEHR